ncbi:hypothetical protein NUW54_g3854 [Trametes sanguinea]|uniref:Uncharacterized protein n=1 Tax=Trametes sanguinea TaxID=158606 RepID=A0ACC1PZK8_9APHY|nr:hypothetical protein NUW54_g3854 [Trametes sanguinea]
MPVSTRSSNSENHPGVVDAPNPRCSHNQVKAAKEAEEVKRKLRDRKREETLARKKIEMAAEEKAIHITGNALLSQMLGSAERAAGKQKRESKPGSTNKSSKRKPKDIEVQESVDDAASQSDAPTPSPYVTQSNSKSESELSEPIGGWSSSEDGIVVEETPKPLKKKAKKAMNKVKESLWQRVEAVKTGLAEFDVDMADAVSEAPTSSSTATQQYASLVSSAAKSKPFSPICTSLLHHRHTTACTLPPLLAEIALASPPGWLA